MALLRPSQAVGEITFPPVLEPTRRVIISHAQTSETIAINNPLQNKSVPDSKGPTSASQHCGPLMHELMDVEDGSAEELPLDLQARHVTPLATKWCGLGSG
jgi:hypothetical protein